MLKQVLISESVGKTIEAVRFYADIFIMKYTDNTFSCRYNNEDSDKDELRKFLTYDNLRWDIYSNDVINSLSSVLIEMGIIDETLLRQARNKFEIDKVNFQKQRDFKEYQRLKKIFENEHTDQSSN